MARSEGKVVDAPPSHKHFQHLAKKKLLGFPSWVEKYVQLCLSSSADCAEFVSGAYVYGLDIIWFSPLPRGLTATTQTFLDIVRFDLDIAIPVCPSPTLPHPKSVGLCHFGLGYQGCLPPPLPPPPE